MDDKLLELLYLLKNINSENNLISNEDIEEQFQNLIDFKDVITDFETVLSLIKEKDLKNLTELEINLFEVHRVLTTLEWHLSEISELNTKIIKRIK
ncbi:hypothetical protein ACIQZI_13905 [Peribacillus sp. NPDC096379]|uniref:hypothetical protein n=1 Tax=Peribacillus sp. NPDC096379 TaxID=3364393 RepID=UPI00380112E6